MRSFYTTNPKKRSLDGDDLVTMHKKPCSIRHVPDFECLSYYMGDVLPLRLSSLLEDYSNVVLFFYERDFTPNALMDIEQIRTHYPAFINKNALPVMVSTDTAMVHRGFCSPGTQGGIGQPPFPLVGDAARFISRSFDVLDKAGSARRAVFVLNRERNIVYSFTPEQSHYSMHVILSII